MEDLAIIGMACNLPNASNIKEFWNLLCINGNGVMEIPEKKWDKKYFTSKDKNIPGKIISNKGGFVNSFEEFDTNFFKMTTIEAETIDPQHREVMRLSWEAIEDAGLRKEDLSNTNTGVIMGLCFSEYSDLYNICSEKMNTYSMPGLSRGMAANRVSHFLNLNGPSLITDTACSSTFTALHIAANMIWSGDMDMSLVGGIQLFSHNGNFIGFSKLGATGPTGRCQSFDAKADGYVRSEGSGVFFIKKYKDAVSNGDRIYCKIRSISSNHDGYTVPITNPNSDAQEKLMRNAYKKIGIMENDTKIAGTQYIEAHGTGTQAGDTSETNAINRVFKDEIKPYVGSVKSNIGHLESASAAASLIKTSLAIYNKKIPGIHGLGEINPKINTDNIQLNKEMVEWNSTKTRRASINSFGFGGSNTHVIIEEANNYQKKHIYDNKQQLIPLLFSANNEISLKSILEEYKQLILNNKDTTIHPQDIYSTLIYRKSHLNTRCFILCEKEKIENSIDCLIKNERCEYVKTTIVSDNKPKILMAFCGQGAQWNAMGKELLNNNDNHYSVFRETMKKSHEYIKKYGGWDLFNHLSREENDELVMDTTFSQGACCALQCSLVDLMEDWGIKPDAVIGHSVGEVPAGYAAGIYSLEEALRLSVCRGEIMNKGKGKGGMASVGLSKEEAIKFIKDNNAEKNIVVSNINSPKNVTISGDIHIIEKVVGLLEDNGIFVRKLKFKYAFHSHHMKILEPELLDTLKWFNPKNKPKIPFYSCVSGERIDDINLIHPNYMANSMSGPVEFVKAMDSFFSDLKDNPFISLEIGPHPVLSGLIKQCVDGSNKNVDYIDSIITLKRKTPEVFTTMFSIASLHNNGIKVNWDKIVTKIPYYPKIADIVPIYKWDSKTISAQPSHDDILCSMDKNNPPKHAFLGNKLTNTLEHIWVNIINIKKFPWLSGHVAHGSIVIPGAVFLSMIVQVGKEFNSFKIQDFNILQAMTITENDNIVLQTYLDIVTKEVKIRSKKNNVWVEHAKATIINLSNSDDFILNNTKKWDELPEMNDDYPVDRYYNSSPRFGFVFSGDFKRFSSIKRGVFELLTEYPSMDEDNIGNDYDIHPINIDKAIQSAVIYFPRISDIYMPDSAKTVYIKKDIHVRGIMNVYVEQYKYENKFDITLYHNNEPIMKLQEFSFIKLENESEKPYFDRNISSFTTEMVKTEKAIENTKWDFLNIHNSHIEKKLLEAFHIMDYDINVHDQINNNDKQIDDKQIDDKQIDDKQIDDKQETYSLNEKLTDKNIIYVVNDNLNESINVIKKFLNAKKILFITKNCLGNCENLSHAAVIGLIRSLRNEYMNIQMNVIDIDEKFRIKDILFHLDTIHPEILIRDSQAYVNVWKQYTQELKPIENTENFVLDIKKRGILNSLYYKSINRHQTLKGDEIEIKVMGTGVNFRDIMVAMGGISRESTKYGYIGYNMGLECSGIIERVGKNVTEYKKGDKVLAFARNPYSKYVVTNKNMIANVPENIDLITSSAIPTCYLTAYAVLFDIADIKKDDVVLIHGAAGGVGLAVIQLAKMVGAIVIGTASSENKRKVPKEYGADHVLYSRSLNFTEDIMNISKNGVNLIINSYSDDTLQRNFDLLKPFGYYVEIGKKDLSLNTSIGMKALTRNITYRVYDLDQYMVSDKQHIVNKNLKTIMNLFHQKKIRLLPTTKFSGNDIVESFRFMQQGKHTGKIVVDYSNCEINIDKTFYINNSKQYLITGAFSGLGLDIAEWMIKECNIKELVLISRSGPKESSAKNAIKRMESNGAKINIIKCDVNNYQALLSSITPFKNIGGIIHAATVYNDKMFNQATIEDFDKVMGPKYYGGLNLHKISLELKMQLEFFICFSSVSAVLGNIGQSNYCAANYGLEALTSYRRSIGLPSSVINFGPIVELGYLARNSSVEEMLSLTGFIPLVPSQVIDSVKEIILTNCGQLLVAGMDFDKIASTIPFINTIHFDNIRNNSVKSSVGNGDKLIDSIKNLDDKEKHIKLVDLIVEQCKKMTGDSNIATNIPFEKLGIDSLISTELRAWFVKDVGVEVSLFEIGESKSISHLSSSIIDKL